MFFRFFPGSNELDKCWFRNRIVVLAIYEYYPNYDMPEMLRGSAICKDMEDGQGCMEGHEVMLSWGS